MPGLLKRLGHPARIAILKHLASLDNCCFNEISKGLPLADSTVSQHLSELKNAGLNENWELLRKFLREFADIKIVKYER